jgi:hypothetical protein
MGWCRAESVGEEGGPKDRGGVAKNRVKEKEEKAERLERRNLPQLSLYSFVSSILDLLLCCFFFLASIKLLALFLLFFRLILLQMSFFKRGKKGPTDLVKSTKKYLDAVATPDPKADEKTAKKVTFSSFLSLPSLISFLLLLLCFGFLLLTLISSSSEPRKALWLLG